MKEDYKFTIKRFKKENLSSDELKNSLLFNENLEIYELKRSESIINNKIMIVKNKINFLNKPCLLLEEICEISQGIVEATDRISYKMLNKVQNKKDYKVGQGVFVFNINELKKINPNESEKKFLKPYLDAQDVSRYYYKWKNNFVWYVGNKENKKIKADKINYKNMKKYLDYVSRFITSSNKPYGIHRTRDSKFFKSPKLLCKNMINKPCFAYCEEEFYINMSFNVIIQKIKDYSLKYILGILNSKFGEYWFNSNAKKRGINVDIGVGILKKFPIKRIDFNNKYEIEIYQKIVNDVEIVISLYKQLNDNKGMTADAIKSNIDKVDKEIDNLVYELYGLTEEEIKIIEEIK